MKIAACEPENLFSKRLRLENVADDSQNRFNFVVACCPIQLHVGHVFIHVA